MTVAEFIRQLGISRTTWHKLKRSGNTPAIIEIGGIQRISAEAAEEWLAENQTRASAEAAHRAVEGRAPLQI